MCRFEEGPVAQPHCLGVTAVFEIGSNEIRASRLARLRLKDFGAHEGRGG